MFTKVSGMFCKFRKLRVFIVLVAQKNLNPLRTSAVRIANVNCQQSRYEYFEVCASDYRYRSRWVLCLLPDNNT